MFGDMEEKQKLLKAKLAETIVEAEAGDGALVVKANANRELINIRIDPSIIDPQDPEQLEDLLLVAVNRVMQMAAEKEAAEGQKLIQDMLPPGLSGLTDLFQ
ncbi:MAG: YbaB/EbfC family nucleoid-associated protein [Bacteroidota bacterium]